MLSAWDGRRSMKSFLDDGLLALNWLSERKCFSLFNNILGFGGLRSANILVVRLDDSVEDNKRDFTGSKSASCNRYNIT